MAALNERRIRQLLNSVVDPCSAAAGAPAGLNDMGLVRAVELRDGPAGLRVCVRIALTEPSCMMGPAFMASARDVLSGVDGVAEVSVTLDDAGDWCPDDMDPGYARRLSMLRRRQREVLDR